MAMCSPVTHLSTPASTNSAPQPETSIILMVSEETRTSTSLQTRYLILYSLLTPPRPPFLLSNLDRHSAFLSDIFCSPEAQAFLSSPALWHTEVMDTFGVFSHYSHFVSKNYPLHTNKNTCQQPHLSHIMDRAGYGNGCLAQAGHLELGSKSTEEPLCWLELNMCKFREPEVNMCSLQQRNLV